MSITAGLSATKTGFELLKGLRELLKREQFDPAEINARLLELQDYLLDARQALSEAEEENRNLRTALDDKNRIREFGNQFERNEGVYWYENYPYCPVCWEANQQPIRLSGPYSAHIAKGLSKWTCPTHQSVFYLRHRINENWLETSLEGI